MKATICLLLIFLTGCASTKVSLLGVGVIGSSVADVETTQYALDNGAHEANPIVRPFVSNRGLFYAAKGALAAGLMAWTESAVPE